MAKYAWMGQGGSVCGGFDEYVTWEEVKNRRDDWRRPRIEVLPTDTSASLKLKRGGVCEFPGCTVTEGLEWHHEEKTLPAEKGWGDGEFWTGV
jgi:hypothetical protein